MVLYGVFGWAVKSNALIKKFQVRVIRIAIFKFLINCWKEKHDFNNMINFFYVA